MILFQCNVVVCYICYFGAPHACNYLLGWLVIYHISLDISIYDSGFLNEPRDAHKLIAGTYDKELQRLVDGSNTVTESEMTWCKEGKQNVQLQHEPDKG